MLTTLLWATVLFQPAGLAPDVRSDTAELLRLEIVWSERQRRGDRVIEDDWRFTKVYVRQAGASGP